LQKSGADGAKGENAADAQINTADQNDQRHSKR